MHVPRPFSRSSSTTGFAYPMRFERAGGVVDENAGSAELGQPPGLRDERVGLAGGPRAVDEARLELALRSGDRITRLAQVGDVVERVVEPEDVDAAVSGRGDEPLDEVRAHRSRARLRRRPLPARARA